MCDRCADLEDQLAAAKRALGEVESGNDLAVVRKWFGLSKGQARLMLRLYRVKHRFLPYWLLAEELANPDADPATIKVVVWHMRRKIGHEAIENQDSVGYRLSPGMLVRVREALEAGI